MARITTRTRKKNDVKRQETWELEARDWKRLARELKCLAPLSRNAGADRMEEPSGTPGGGALGGNDGRLNPEHSDLDGAKCAGFQLSWSMSMRFPSDYYAAPMVKQV